MDIENHPSTDYFLSFILDLIIQTQVIWSDLFLS